MYHFYHQGSDTFPPEPGIIEEYQDGGSESDTSEAVEHGHQMDSRDDSTTGGSTMASRQENQPPSAFQLLAVELQHKIIPLLDPIGLVSLSQSCQYFRRLIDPGTKELAERLLQVELFERYGGWTPLCYISGGILKPIWNLKDWEAHRWACTACLRLLQHTDFDNHSILGDAYRKPPFTSPAANPTTSWLPSLREKAKERSPESPEQVEEGENEFEVPRQRNKHYGRACIGYRRWRRKCNECRFQAGELGPKRSINDSSGFPIYKGGTQNVPIQKSRGLYFESCLERWFPDLSDVLSRFFHLPSSSPGPARPAGLDVTALRWTTYMIRCPCCTKWQEMRNFRFGSVKNNWFPYHQGDGVVASEAYNEASMAWDVSVRTQLDDLLCNRCFTNEHGDEALAAALLEWLQIPMLRYREQLEQRLRTPIENLERFTRYDWDLRGIVAEQQEDIQPGHSGLLRHVDVRLFQRHHDQFSEFWDRKKRSGSRNPFGNRTPPPPEQMARFRAATLVFGSKLLPSLERNKRIHTWKELFHIFRSHWEFLIDCEDQFKRRPQLLVDWTERRKDVSLV
ncbi:unnamed protein product [Clonostachys byssicola]|uniref:F-box domain-containing protein n=1 Tax=Clonostachys byssicola TaxID=160290 RepID=A0A9N9UBX1_9HYPO|nr:unnamed protein product [Clonostachys byssicola]